MLGYICKYAPIEIFESMGVKMRRIEPEVTNFNQADRKMHPNICSFAKGVLEEVMAKDYEGILLTTCCDSIRRLYDVLREELPNRFIYLIDVPRITKEAGIALYEKRIRNMIGAYEEFSGKKFRVEKLKDILLNARAGETISLKKDCKNIGIVGARANQNIKKILEEKGANVAFDLTCTGLSRKLLLEEDALLKGYARGLLSQFPCMRMEEAAGRDDLVLKYADSVDGIIYHTVQFCDNYAYEYAWLKDKIKKPKLLLETDYTKQSYGQILTRIEAFLESLGGLPGRGTGDRTGNGQKSGQKNGTGDRARPAKGGAPGRKDTKYTGKQGGGSEMYVMGLDSGSTSTNAVILNGKGKIVAFSVVRTGAKSGESAEKILHMALEKARLKREQIERIVSTGYGRVSIEFADENVTEISCHGKGAHYFNPKIRTILDIGGQDSKAIRLNREGEVVDFAMNDKCAAGTGRFLEMIARSLEVEIGQLGAIALKSTEDIEITSMCSVFAESEVISLIANNKEKTDIANGICRSIAGKAASLMKRVGMEPDYMMTGGVAKNPGVVRAVEEKIGAKLYICPEPEIVGATGAAIYALNQVGIQA